MTLPNNATPTYTETARDDALFHYTTADGLLGIIRDNQIRGTAFYCVNDESELSAGKGLLTPLFRRRANELIQSGDARLLALARADVNPLKNPENFEQLLIDLMLGALCVYITCFCKSNAEEDFRHGLLSQWRGYGADGGYAIQFSRSRLAASINELDPETEGSYQLTDVYYNAENALKKQVLKHSDAFVRAYEKHVGSMLNFMAGDAAPVNPLADLGRKPIEAFFDFIIHTKNQHFAEERECRLSILDAIAGRETPIAVHYFNRRGLIVPYAMTPSALDVVGCIDWIVVGPGPRMESRVKAVGHMLKKNGLNVRVRPSHIPLSRG